jgi:hypothetical protein
MSDQAKTPMALRASETSGASPPYARTKKTKAAVHHGRRNDRFRTWSKHKAKWLREIEEGHTFCGDIGTLPQRRRQGLISDFDATEPKPQLNAVFQSSRQGRLKWV